MAVQLLEQDGFGAAHGGAHASRGQVESGGELGVAQAAVPEHQGGSLAGRQPGECGPDGSPLVAADHEVGDVGHHGQTVVGDLFAGATTAAGGAKVKSGVWGPGPVSQRRAPPAGPEEGPRTRTTSWATSSAESREPRTRAATPTTRA